MGDGGHVLDGGDFNTDRLHGTYSGFTTGTGPLYAHFHFTQAVTHGLAAGVLAHHLPGIGRALAGTLKAHLAGGGPADDIAALVSHSYDGVIERGGNVNHARGNVFAALGLQDFGLVIIAAQTKFRKDVLAGSGFLISSGAETAAAGVSATGAEAAASTGCSAVSLVISSLAIVKLY